MLREVKGERMGKVDRDKIPRPLLSKYGFYCEWNGQHWREFDVIRQPDITSVSKAHPGCCVVHAPKA